MVCCVHKQTKNLFSLTSLNSQCSVNLNCIARATLDNIVRMWNDVAWSSLFAEKSSFTAFAISTEHRTTDIMLSKYLYVHFISYFCFFSTKYVIALSFILLHHRKLLLTAQLFFLFVVHLKQFSGHQLFS